MAVCLEYQAIHSRRNEALTSLRLQVCTALLLLCALVAKVWVKLEATDLGYELAREKHRAVELDMERRELELQVSLLVRPDSLSRLADERLGLRALDPQQARKITGSFSGRG